MRRSAFLVILLAILLLIAACGSSGSDSGSMDESSGLLNNTQEDDVQKDESDSSEDVPNHDTENTAVKLTLSSDEKLTVAISIKAASNKDASVIVVKDSADADVWQSNPEKVLALGQLTLDDEGKGSISLPIAQLSSYTVLVSYEGGSELAVWQ